MSVKYKIPEDIKDFISNDALKKFIKEARIHIPGTGSTKPERISLIEDAVDNGSVSLAFLEKFVANELRRGYNRTLFFAPLKYGSIHKLKSLRYVEEKLIFSSIQPENTSDFLNSTRPEGPFLAYLNISTNGINVDKIELCYSEKVSLTRKLNDTFVPYRYDTDFVWIELSIPEKRILIRLRQRSNTSSETAQKKTQFLNYLNFIKEIFDIETEESLNKRETLYKIYRELTAKAEKPFIEKAEVISKETEDFTSHAIKNLPITSSKIIDDFRDRIKGLLIRSLIQENFPTYTAYSEGKRGIVEWFYYTDGTGASVNAKAGDDDKSISLYDIYLDTKHSIDKLRIIDRARIVWYKKKTDTKIERIRTKFEVFKECYIIHFLYEYLTEEVENHVLSELKSFEQL